MDNSTFSLILWIAAGALLLLFVMRRRQRQAREL